MHMICTTEDVIQRTFFQLLDYLTIAYNVVCRCDTQILVTSFAETFKYSLSRKQ